MRSKVKDPYDFEWQKQARFYWHEEKKTVQVSICDVDFEYCFEYLGLLRAWGLVVEGGSVMCS